MKLQYHVDISDVPPCVVECPCKLLSDSINIFILICRQTTLLEVPIGFSVAMSCVLTNRIILNVREANKEMNRLSIPACQVTIGDDGSRTTLSDAGLTQLRSLRAQRV